MALMGGIIEKLLPPDSPTFGFIKGDDGRQYFFIPSGLTRTSPVAFVQLSINQRVMFEPYVHSSKGMRARDVRIESHGNYA